MNPFSDGVAVITGAGAGIGAGLARHAAALGMTVVLADIDADAIAEVRAELCAAGYSAVSVVCDVRDPDSVQELAERTYRDVGPARLLVNNAGVEQFGYIMSKHAVLALTECLYLDVQLAGHDHHIHVQAVLPGAVVSNIFDSAGGVDPSDATDAAAAERQRSAMLDVKAAAMDPLAAAATIFEQAAEGRFYLLTDPESVGAAMAERANVLATQWHPFLRT